MTKKKKKRIYILTVSLVLLIAALFLVFFDKEDENLSYVTQDYGLKENEAQIILENEIYTENAFIKDGAVYIPFALATEKLSDGFYEDEDENDDTIFYVLPTKILKFTPDKKYYIENDERVYPDAPVFITENEKVYIEISFLNEISDMKYAFYENPNRVVINYEWTDFLYNTVKDETPVHAEDSVTSGIVRKLSASEKVYYIGGYGNNKNNFVKIMTLDGIFGYIQRKHVESAEHIVSVSDYTAPAENHILYDEKIRLGWWYVASKAGNATYSESVKNASSMNVISPTWISLADDYGNITSFADKTYVGRAHSDGYKVWILVDFPDGEVSPHKNLSINSSRENLINNLVQETIDTGADGINIDFEALSVQTGPHFVEFIKELSVKCHLAGLVLSVDNLVPSYATEHYDIEEQAKYADYIVVMTYDEHYAASTTAGSVASIGFVRDAITDTAKMCERSRIIMGIPFYTRLWKSDSQGLTSEVYSITAAERYISKNNLTKTWDAETCQNKVEFTKDGSVYTMWCEDTESVAYKCADAVSGDLAGVACWRLGLENSEIWPVIGNYIK